MPAAERSNHRSTPDRAAFRGDSGPRAAATTAAMSRRQSRVMGSGASAGRGWAVLAIIEGRGRRITGRPAPRTGVCRAAQAVVSTTAQARTIWVSFIEKELRFIGIARGPPFCVDCRW
jgi:hypothetical protein